MSEQKRATLTSLGSTKKDKKTKELPKTVRFTLTLAESNEEACPEFNYRVLLGSAERKRKAAAAAAAAAATAAGVQGGERDCATQNGLDPFASDDEDRLKDLARQFEEKYGGGGGGGRKRHGRFEDYVDLGAGYDENDPFIDNTDAYDEIVPEEITTAHGGFYINCGQLEFKEVIGLSDGDDDHDVKVKKTLKKPKIKRTPLRGTNAEQPELVRKRKFVSHEREFLKKKKKLAIVDLRKKGQTVKDLLREKRSHLPTTTFSKNGSTVVPAQSPGTSPINSPASSESKKPTVASDSRKPASATSIVDAIESVVSAAARSNDDSSQDSSSSVSKTGSGSSGSSDNTDDSQDAVPSSTALTLIQTPTSLSTPDVKSSSIPLIPPTQLPPGLPTPAASPVSVGSRGDETHLPSDLPSDLVNLLTTLKKAAESSAEGKCKFFSNDVNQTLLRVEQKAQALSCSRRQLVYGHLALFLPCTKDTLMKRAKKLRLNSEELKLKEPMARLEAAVNRMMPVVLEQYTRQCQKVAEEKSNDEGPSLDGKETRTRIPRKTFPWNADTRSLLQQVVSIKRQCLLLQKPRKESKEELLRAFLESSVLPLWPPGWMKLNVLLRESGLRPGGAHRNFSTNIVASPIVVASSTSTTSSATITPLPGPKVRKSGVLKKASASTLTTQAPPASAASPPAPSRMKVEAAAPSPLHPPPPLAPPGRQSPYTNSGSPGAGPAPKATKSVIERVPTKGLDLSIGAAARAVLSGSPTKLKGGSEISIIPMSGPGRPPPLTPPPAPTGPAPPPPATQSAAVSAAAGLPLINIPDCISVTPASLPPPPSPAPSASAPGPRPMSLKQRILLDTGNQRLGPRTHPPQTRPSDDEGIEVIEITEAPPVASPRSRPDQPRKKPQRPRPDPAEGPAPPPPPPPPPPPQPQSHPHVPAPAPAPSERDAETDAATDLLSQIIHDSLSNYPNSGSEAPAPAPTLSGTGAPSTARDVPQPAHHRSVIQRPARGSPPKQPPPKPPPAESGGGGGSGAENARETPQPADAEVSVQLEVDRVMKELIELQGHISGEKKEAPAPSPPAAAPPLPEPPKISSAVSVVALPPRGVSTAARTGCGSGLGAAAGTAPLPRLSSREPDVTFTPLPRAPSRTSTAAAATAAAGVVGAGPAPLGGSADLTAPRYGHSFQEEFQKHLFQEVRPRNKTILPNAGTGASEAKKYW